MKSCISRHHAALCAALSLSIPGCSHARSEAGATPPPGTPIRLAAVDSPSSLAAAHPYQPSPHDSLWASSSQDLFRHDELKLTPDQKEKITSVYKDIEDQMKKVMVDQKLTMPEKRTRLIALFPEREEKVDALLTPDQQKTLADIRINEAVELQMAPMMNSLVRGLNLSAEQKKSLDPVVREEPREAAQATAAPGDRAGLPKRMFEIRQKADESTKAILTADQYPAYLRLTGRRVPGAR